MSFLGDILFTVGEGDADISLGDRDLAQDEGLESAVICSLFSDIRADEDDLEYNNNDTRRGWWGDNVDTSSALGSKFWLLARRKLTASLLPEIRETFIDSLQWLVDDGAASKLEVSVVREGVSNISVQIAILAPPSEPRFFNYYFNWQSQSIRRAA